MKENIFENITSDQQAYWIGFLAADGSLNGNRLTIGLSSKDREHIIKFKDFIQSNSNILDRMTLCSTNGKRYPSSYISIYSKKLIYDLAQYGIVRDKSHKNIDFLQYIDNRFKQAFIVGFFDGDGWFSNTKKTITVGFCGNKNLMYSIANYLNNYFQWEKSIKVYKDKKTVNTFYIQTSSKEKIKDFCKMYLSFQDNNILLLRKQLVATSILEKINISKIEQEKKQKAKIIKKCPVCKKDFYIINQPNQIYCSQECVHIAQRVSDRPTREELKFLIRNQSFLSIGKQFNVTDNAIRKWCKSYNLPFKKTIIQQMSDEEWNEI